MFAFCAFAQNAKHHDFIYFNIVYMCYSLESSLFTSSISLISIFILYSSQIPKYQWLAFTLMGWSFMQLSEAAIWGSMKFSKCNIVNKFMTIFIIPIVLMMQPLGSLYGSFYVIKWENLSQIYKLICISLVIITIFAVLYNQFSDIKRWCTVVTKKGHLNWLLSSDVISTSDENRGKYFFYKAFGWAFMIALPLLLFWKNKFELLLMFLIPLFGVLYGIFYTDAYPSVWCFITSFSSILFLIMYFFDTNKYLTPK